MSKLPISLDLFRVFGLSAGLRAIGLAIALAGSMVASVTPSVADPVRLDGSWSGPGSVTYPSGAKEAARCLANFKKKTGTSYSVSARCASPSGKVEQSAVLTSVSDNVYSGSFFNAEYKVDGTITVTINGNVQNVSITTPAGSSAYFKLKR
ncbi:MAG: hypothetical protein NW216_10860 [Hyphomicrobium sp.]|nr:hypothetical protein [Hyphomicrobium sp.]